MIYQAQVPLGGLPVNLMLVGNQEYGKVVFVRVAPVGVILDHQPHTAVSAWFDDEGFTLFSWEGGEDFKYNLMYDYKEIPLMLRWLQQQNLQQPQ